MNKLFRGAVLLLGAGLIWFAMQPRSEWPSLAPLNSEISSGQCAAVRKQSGKTLWLCADGSERWIESYMHKDKQGGWTEPAGCKFTRPIGASFTDADAKRYKACPDGQSFWVE